MSRGGQKARIKWHRDPRVISIVFQLLAVATVVWFIAYLAGNTAENLEQRGIVVGFDWLEKVAPFQVGFSPFIPFELGKTTYLEIFLIAVQNTIFVSFFGIIAATILGFIIGVLRLSPNWLVAQLATCYIEFFRNVPLLLWFFFWYIAVFLPLFPAIRDSIDIGGAIFINKEGFYFPRPIIESAGGTIAYVILLVLAVVGLGLFAKKMAQKQDETGEQFPVFWVNIGGFLLVAIVGFLVCGSPISLEYAEAGRFQMSGGINLNTSLFVCWFALTTYTAAFIAENVRGGILAVNHGQTEAAAALGLRHGRILRFVVIPQAMRVIIPPTISQYLNLTKNSTLAVAVAYEEVASLWMGITLNTTGQSLIIIAMAVGVFWLLSFLTSALLNWYNSRVQLRER